MPHGTVKITSGVVTVETPALNEAGISACNLIRYKPDPQGLMLVETLGGWSRFYATQITNPVRALQAWEDTNANKWIAYGTSSMTASSLVAIQCSQNATTGITTASSSSTYQYNITPQYLSDSTQIIFSTTAGSSLVVVTDQSITGLSGYDGVFISTPVSVGGLILSGQYAITSLAGDQYEINATNILQQPAYAAYSTLSSPIAVTGGTYSAGSPSTLTLTYATQAAAPFIVNEAVKVTGLVPLSWNGSCIVTACTTTQVTLIAPSGASGSYSSGGSLTNTGVAPLLAVASGSSTVTVTLPDHGLSVGSTFTVLNQTVVGGISLYGNYIVQSVANSYTFTINGSSTALMTVTNYVNAVTVSGGSSTTSAVTLQLGASTYVYPVVTITGGTSTTSAVTLTWSTPSYTFQVGASIYVSGIVTPSAWNGAFVVTGSTTTSVTYALSGSATSWGSGGAIQAPLFNIGSYILVSGVTPTAWNGNFVVTSSTTTSVTYALTGSALSWTNGGSVADIGGDEDFVYTITAGTPATSTGYGVGGYGTGGYGTGQPSAQVSGSPIFATTWSLDNWGQILLACPIGFTPIDYAPNTYLTYQPIFYWDPTTQAPQPAIIANGPPSSTGIFVAMPQRQVIAWGTTFAGIVDPLLIRWCDVNNFNVWIAQTTNQAGSFRLPTGSAIIGALQVAQQALVWTDIGLWSMQYIGPPYVYSFNQIGQGCGLIARKAAGVLNGVTYWMGSRQFFNLTSEGVQIIPCPVWDSVFQNLDLANLSKITFAANSLFSEVTWYYPVTGGTGEVSAYVKYNVLLQQWDYGTLGRSAWIDSSVLGPPIGYDPANQYIYQHEISAYADSAEINAFFTTGYFAISDGDMKCFVDQWWPDMKWGYYNQTQGAQVNLTFSVLDYPNSTPLTYGPYTLTASTTYFSPRFRGRLVSMTFASGNSGTFWRVGLNRYRFNPDGKF